MADDDSLDYYVDPSPLNSVVFPRKLLKRFINLYKELPCLWDRKCPGYKQKQLRHEAITRLTRLVQEHDPTATRVHVLRKIESLRACVRREHKRVRDSRLQAKRPEEIYKPHLWYYDLFSFVFTDDGYTTYTRNRHKKKKEKEPEPTYEDSSDETQPDEEQGYDAPAEYEQSMDPADYALETSMVEVDDNKQYNYEEEPKTKRHRTEVADEYDAIGVNVAAKLRNLPQNMRILAEKLINDVLYQAQLDALNSTTVISTPVQFKQDRDPIS